MNDTAPAALAALQQRFRALVTEFWENHGAWQEAGRVHDRLSQAALIVREAAILTASKEVIAAYQALLASPVERPARGEQPPEQESHAEADEQAAHHEGPPQGQGRSGRDRVG
jgi:hypothetical protein